MYLRHYVASIKSNQTHATARLSEPLAFAHYGTNTGAYSPSMRVNIPGEVAHVGSAASVGSTSGSGSLNIIIEGVEGAAAAYTGTDGLSKSKEQWGVSLYVLRRDSKCAASASAGNQEASSLAPPPPSSGQLRMRGVLVRRCGKSGKTNQGCVMVLPHARVHDHAGNNPDPFRQLPMVRFVFFLSPYSYSSFSPTSSFAVF